MVDNIISQLEARVSCILSGGIDEPRLTAYQAEYCPPLDPALFAAIALDHANDLSDTESVKSLCATLDALKASAIEQEDSEFDPSGTGAGNLDSVTDGASHNAESLPATSGHAGDVSSLSNGLQSLEIDSSPERDVSSTLTADHGALEYARELDQLDKEEKLELLKAAFPNSSDFTISHTLGRCRGQLDRAMDELLNHAYIEDGETSDQDGKMQLRGIDAFSEDNAGRRGRKKNRKKKGQVRSDETDKRGASVPSQPATKSTTSWKSGQADIEYISKRVNVPRGKVSALFFQHGATIASTIRAMINDPSLAPATAKIESSDPVVQAHAFELGEEFPKIPAAQLAALVRLTHPSTSDAHDLAKAVSINHSNPSTLKIVTQYEPLNIDEDYGSPDEWTVVSNKKTPSPPANGQGSSGSALAKTIALRDQRARVQAAAAARKARSNRLMNGAAGYYSQVSRDEAVARRDFTAQQADAHVRAQSTRGTVDLHGVSVPHALRIARAKTHEWWQAGGRRVKGLDGRVSVQGGDAPPVLNIVTGLGRHSEGGRAKIGPAVGRMLEREGWHTSYDEGVWTVSGKR
ncbi:MAG: hypothetical protein M1828_000615 [Chrysothrix sp. TS-e1954]|nr:MAG: hypothetical protein M1828_000615 [Chrysothrix sp. TS-e1954]